MKCIYSVKVKSKKNKIQVKEIPLSQEEGFKKLLRDLNINSLMLDGLL